MKFSISLGIELVLPTQCLIKQALCTLPRPLWKGFELEQGAEHAART